MHVGIHFEFDVLIYYSFEWVSLPQIKLIVCVLIVCIWEDLRRAKVLLKSNLKRESPSDFWGRTPRV